MAVDASGRHSTPLHRERNFSISSSKPSFIGEVYFHLCRFCHSATHTAASLVGATVCMSMSKTSAPMFCDNFNSRNVVGLSTRIPSTQSLFSFLPSAFQPSAQMKRAKKKHNFSQAPDISHKNHLPSQEHARKKELFRFFSFSVLS